MNHFPLSNRKVFALPDLSVLQYCTATCTIAHTISQIGISEILEFHWKHVAVAKRTPYLGLKQYLESLVDCLDMKVTHENMSRLDNLRKYACKKTSRILNQIRKYLSNFPLKVN